MATPYPRHRPSAAAAAAAATTATSSHPSPPPRFRRRQRVINSCFECRKRKMRCSKTYPCYNCSRFGRHCVFVALKDPEVRAALLGGGAKSDRSGSEGGPLSQAGDDDDTGLFFPTASEDGKAKGGSSDGMGVTGDKVLGGEAEVDRWHMYDSMFEADAEDELMDLGLSIGRLCISERIGGLFRPGFAEMIDGLLARSGGHVPEKSATGYSGSMAVPIQNMQSSMPIEPSFDLLQPWHQATTVISLFSVVDRKEVDVLYHQYFKAVEPLAHVIHKPTFDRQFFRIFLTQDLSRTATKSFTALVFAMFLAAAISLTQSQPQVQLQTTKAALVDKLKVATERSLVAAQYMKSVKLETLQAFTIYLIPQVGGQISRAQSSLVGALVRLAQCAGLHRDASASDTSPLECHIRGLLWYQICFLDLHTCEAQGPQPMLHDSDYDTPLPLNVDDLAFEVSTLPVPSTGWADATFSLMRYEINDIHKLIFRERIAVSKNETNLPAVRAGVEARMRAVVHKYLDKLDDRIPIQRCARLAGTSLLSRCLPMVLQIFIKLDDTSETQQEIRNAMVNSSLDMMEASATLETATDLTPWAWFAPTYQQYHGIFLPLVMLYLDPNMPQAARAGAMIDHVFGTCYGISRQQRCADILRMLVNECGAFMKLRKVKHLYTGSSRSSEASPPNIEAAFEEFRQSHQQKEHETTNMPLDPLNMDQQTLESLVASYTGAPMTMDDWWSMPDQFDLTDPAFYSQGPT